MLCCGSLLLLFCEEGGGDFPQLSIFIHICIFQTFLPSFFTKTPNPPTPPPRYESPHTHTHTDKSPFLLFLPPFNQSTPPQHPAGTRASTPAPRCWAGCGTRRRRRTCRRCCWGRTTTTCTTCTRRYPSTSECVCEGRGGGRGRGRGVEAMLWFSKKQKKQNTLPPTLKTPTLKTPTLKTPHPRYKALWQNHAAELRALGTPIANWLGPLKLK